MVIGRTFIVSLTIFLTLFLLNNVFGDLVVHNNFGPPEMRGDFNDEYWRDDENDTQDTKCIVASPCLSDTDCGGSGTCEGGRLCECTCGEKAPCIVPAISFLLETLNGSPQSKCGGLKNACNETTNECECEKAYIAAGFANTTDAFGKICIPAKNCTNVRLKWITFNTVFQLLFLQNDDCIGMTCLRGLCKCPIPK
uniref:EB domain-containing protein n=1 Tax=Meloidogyne hapla TaxID=6305 RepID=A0A1I8BRJ6_MELHA